MQVVNVLNIRKLPLFEWDMERMCRICLSASDALVDIFGDSDQSDDEPRLADMLNECVECKVKSDDKLPKKICPACSSDARTAFRFKRRCEHSYKLLTLKLEDRAVEVDVDEFCDMLEAEEWELPKRVLDMDCVKIENEEISTGATVEDDYEEHEGHGKVRHKQESSEESLQENKSPTNADLVSTELVSKRYPSRPSKRKSFKDSCSSDRSKELETITSTDEHKPELRKTKQLKTEQRQYKCLECPKAFRQHKTLQDHIRTHTGERPYKCPHCPKVFAKSHHARDHMHVHSGQKPHKCPHCPKAFIQKSNLQAHIHTHSAEGPYKCTHCAKSFVRNYDLKMHLRAHTGGYPHKCSHCTKSFNRRRDLERHIRVHTGEQPFKCAQCSEGFSRSDQLTTHIRNYPNCRNMERAKRGRKPLKKKASDKK